METLAHKTRFGASALSMWLLSVAAPVGLQSQQASSPARAPDVHFVPTDTAIVRAMLQVAQVDSKDLVYDLGCGDGRIVITAVKRHGARGVCVDIDPARIKESRHNADTAGVASRMKFRQVDLFETDLRPATVVTLYLLPTLNVRLRPKLFRELRPGTRVVSHAFDMGEWKADRVLNVPTAGDFPSFAYFWIVPADVAGSWKVSLSGDRPVDKRGSHDYEVRFEQRYQHVTGATAAKGSTSVPVTNADLVGDGLSFTIVTPPASGALELRLTGRVKGERMTGKVRDGENDSRSWSAVRTERGPRPELEPSATDRTQSGIVP